MENILEENVWQKRKVRQVLSWIKYVQYHHFLSRCRAKSEKPGWKMTTLFSLLVLRSMAKVSTAQPMSRGFFQRRFGAKFYDVTYTQRVHATRSQSLADTYRSLHHLVAVLCTQAQFADLNLASYSDSGTMVDIQVYREGTVVVR